MKSGISLLVVGLLITAIGVGVYRGELVGIALALWGGILFLCGLVKIIMKRF